MGEYSTSEMAKDCGLTVRQVQFYSNEGVVIPDVEASGSQGIHRRFSERNRFQFRVLKELVDCQIKLVPIRNVMITLDHYTRDWRQWAGHEMAAVVIYKGKNSLAVKMRIGSGQDDDSCLLTVGDLKKLGTIYAVVDLTRIARSMLG